MESIPLIDVSSEDDLLLHSSSPLSQGFPNPNSPEKCNEYNCIAVENGSAQEREKLAITSDQMDQVPELSESPEQKPIMSGKVNLRKSLAWDKAFFTSEGVLDAEELAIVNSTFRKTESHALPVIQEDTRKSSESTSTLDSDSLALENLEVDLFENLRASIQKSYGTCNKASSMIHSSRIVKTGDASPCIGPSSKAVLSTQTKMMPQKVFKRYGASDQKQEDTSKEPSIHAQAANKSGNSKSLLKPPRIISRASPLPTVPNKRGSDSGNIQLRSNAAKVISGNVAKGQSLKFTKNYLTDSASVNPRSFPLIKSSSGLSIGNVVPSPASCAFNNSTGTSSDSAGQLPLKITRTKVDCRNNKHSSFGSTSKAPLRTSKSKNGSIDRNNSLACRTSGIQSSSVSPSSSIDSVASDSSSISIGLKSSNSTESLDVGFSSSSPSIPALPLAPRPSELRKLSTGQPFIKNEDPGTFLGNQRTRKVSSTVNASSQSSGGDHARSSINNNLGLKCSKPSGLRMPSPKIGYFDAEKNLVQSSKFSHTGMVNNLLKATGSSNDNCPNKTRSNKLQSLRTASQNATVSCDSPHTGSTKSSSDHCMKAVSKATDAAQRITESAHDNDSSPRTNKGNCLKDFNKAADTVECDYLSSLSTEEHITLSIPKPSTTDLTKGDEPLILDGNSAVKCKTTQPSYQVDEGETINIEIDLIQTANCKRTAAKENLTPEDQNGGLCKDLKDENFHMETVEFMGNKVSSLSL